MDLYCTVMKLAHTERFIPLGLNRADMFYVVVYCIFYVMPNSQYVQRMEYCVFIFYSAKFDLRFGLSFQHNQIYCEKHPQLYGRSFAYAII
jgi:hypothetical protein